MLSAAMRKQTMDIRLFSSHLFGAFLIYHMSSALLSQTVSNVSLKVSSFAILLTNGLLTESLMKRSVGCMRVSTGMLL